MAAAVPSRLSLSPKQNPAAWAILMEFASGSSLTIPLVEERLKALLGVGYKFDDWKPAIDAVCMVEDDSVAVTMAIEKLQSQARAPTERDTQPSAAPSTGMQSTEAASAVTAMEGFRDKDLEARLMKTVEELQRRRRIVGTKPTLEDPPQPN